MMDNYSFLSTRLWAWLKCRDPWFSINKPKIFGHEYRTFLVLLLFFVGLFNSAWSQLSTYTFSTSTGTYTPIASGVNMQLGSTATTAFDAQFFHNGASGLNGTTTSGTYNAFPIGFNFVYDGQTFDGFFIGTDGWIKLGSTTGTPIGGAGSTPISSTTANTNNLISALGSDLSGSLRVASATRTSGSNIFTITGTSVGVSPYVTVGMRISGTGIPANTTVTAVSGNTITMSANATSNSTFATAVFVSPDNISYQTTGVSGSRVLTVQWKNVMRWSAFGDLLNFQIQLFEGSNNIRITYNTIASSTITTSTTMQVGLKGSLTPTLAFNNRTGTGSTAWSGSVAGTTSTSTIPFQGSAATGGSIVPSSGLIFEWAPPSPCSGVPTPGNTIASSASVSPGSTVNLSLQNSIGTGATYQWQSASSSSGPWTNISGATNATASPTVNAVTWYQCLVTCSGNTGTSNPVQVSLAYCVPTVTFGCTDGDVVARVILNTLDNTSGAGCPSGTLGYSDYTSNPTLTTTLQAGSTYQCTVFAGQYSQGYAVWIDYNDNFVFEANERIGFTTTAVAGSGTAGVVGSSVSFPITLSCNPPLGTHRMRVRCIFNTAGSAITPCANASYGEIEDYVVTVSAAEPCPAPFQLTSAVNGANYDLTWNTGCAETEWEVVVQPSGTGIPTGSGVSVTSKPYVVASSSLPAGTQEYYVRAICGGANGNSTWAGPFVFTAPDCSTLVTPTNGQTGVVLVNGGVPIEWSASAGATSYDVYGGTTSGSLTLLGNIATTQVSITGLPFGTTYFWRVVPKNATGDAVGCSEWSFTVQAAPANNLCSGATDLETLVSPITDTTVGFTNNYLPSCNATNTAPDRFYSITVPAGWTLNIGQASNDYDSLHAVFYGSCSNQTEIICTDDPDTPSDTNGAASQVSWLNSTGSSQTVYWVQDGFGSNSGQFTLQWSLLPPPVVVTSFSPNFVCGQAGGAQVVITGSNFTGTTAVQFNGIAAASFVIDSDTQITAVTPAGNIAGPVTVTAAPSSNGTGASVASMTVNSFPVVDPITGTETELCIPNTISLSNNTGTGVWSSADTNIATVTGGEVSGVSAGTTNILYTVTDNGCSTSVSYSVTIKEPVVITTQPTPQAVVTNNNTTFTIAATGTSLSYQWEVSTDGGITFDPITDGGVYSGATTATLALTAVPDTLNGYFYQCVVSGSSPCGPETSLSVMLGVGNTGIATNPSNVSLCGSGTAVFTVVPSGDVDTYQWYQDAGIGPEPLVDGGDVSGANSATLTITNVDTNFNGYTYYVEVVGPANSVNSTSATLLVNTPALITADPTNQTVCYSGGTATFTSAAAGTFTGVQWQYSTDNSSWNNVVNATPVGVTYNGATTTTLTVTTTASTPVLGTYYYRMIALASSPCSNALSTGAQLNINNPAITAQPVAATVLAGATATFSATTNATGTVTYQWQRATTLNGTYSNVVNGTPANVTYNGANTATLSVITTTSTAASTANFYRLVVTSDGCAVNSTGAQLTVNNYCSIPTSTSAASYFDSFATTGGVTNITNSASGFSTNGYGNFTAQSASQLQGQPVSFSTSLVGTTVGVAIWVDWNQNAVFETTERVFNTGAYVSTALGSFTVPATALPGTTRMRIAMDFNATSPLACPASGGRREIEDYSFTVLVPPACSGTPVAGTITATNTSICFSGTSTLTLNGFSTGVTGITFQWYNSQGLIAGANNTTYTTPTLTTAESYFCRVSCTDSGLFADSNTINMTVNTPELNSVTPGERCGTGSVTLEASGSAGSTINWYSVATGGAPIGTGSPFASPSINATTTFYAEAVAGTSTINGARTAPAGTSSTTPFTYGLVFNATSTFTLNSVQVYPNGAAGNVTIQLQDNAGTALQTLSTFAIPSGTGTTAVTVPLGWNITPGTGYRLVATAGSSSLVRESSLGGFPYALGTAGSITNGFISGTSTTYYYFYNWSITVGCPSARQAVVATVNTPPTFSISGSSATICNGSATTTPVTITSNLSDFDSYTWSPTTGVSGDSASGYTFNPTSTTTYTLNALNTLSGCANTATFTVTVNPLPQVFINSSTSTVCSTTTTTTALNATIGSVSGINGGCTTASYGQWPSASYTALTCNGIAVNNVTTGGWAGEYSVVNVTANTRYTFQSSVSTDFITITNADGTVVLASGPNPVIWESSSAGQIRFFTHTDSSCGEEQVDRTRRFICQPLSNTYTWSPIGGLFTDAAGTVPYTGDARSLVYARPLATTTYTITGQTTAGCTATNTFTFTVTPASTWYADADNDGFGNAAVTQLSCSQPVGFVANNTDCNDANAAVFVNGTYYVDADGDGFGSSTASATTICVANASIAPTGFSLNNGDCDDTRANVRPGAIDVCYDGLDNDCNGVIDNVGQPGGCTPIVSAIPTATCGTEVAYGGIVYSSWVTGAQGYRFRVTEVNPADDSEIPGTQVIVDMVLRNLYLHNLSNYKYNAKFKVEVAVRFNNVWQPNYSAPCFLLTPTPVSTMIGCGTQITGINTQIFSTIVQRSNGYRYRVQRLDNALQPVGPVQEIISGIRNFTFAAITDFRYDANYNVSCAVRNTDGSFLPYGPSCTIQAPKHPTTQVRGTQCNDYAVTSYSERIFADAVQFASQYRFRLFNEVQVYDFQVDRALNNFRLSDFPGLVPGETYSVQVAVRMPNQLDFGPYSKTCTVVIPTIARTIEDTAVSAVAFDAQVYPNPFAEQFYFKVATASQESFMIQVYDMMGRAIETRTVNADAIESTEVGANYPAGVYNVILTQGTNVKTLRVVKR
jgi:hypothetical protein